MPRTPPTKTTAAVTALLASILLLAGCSKYQLAKVAASKDPRSAAQSVITSRVSSYKSNPLLLVADAQNAKQQFKQLRAFFKGEVTKTWGKGNSQVASRTRYVKYTQNYKSRAIIDFDAGVVTVETLDQQNSSQSLRSAITTTLLTPNDPRAVDLYSAKKTRLSGTPYLNELVVDQRGRSITSPQRAEVFADYLLKKFRMQRTVKTPKGAKPLHYVKIRMVRNHVDIRARRYAPLIEKNAKRFGVSKNMIYAIIRTESNFNPFAVSSAPAYGLMQLVPTSGGRDAYRSINGKDRVPSSDYLFDAANNIELGTAYYRLINNKYLGRIQNKVSREYCSIAAYNTGSGNVLTTFSSNRDRAVDIINGMTPSQVYNKLRTGLAHQEARRYLIKVLDARAEFANI